MEGFWREIRVALRSLLRTPGYTTAVICILAIAIGVTTALFQHRSRGASQAAALPGSRALGPHRRSERGPGPAVGLLPRLPRLARPEQEFRGARCVEGRDVQSLGLGPSRARKGVDVLGGPSAAVRGNAGARPRIHTRGGSSGRHACGARYQSLLADPPRVGMQQQ